LRLRETCISCITSALKQNLVLIQTILETNRSPVSQLLTTYKRNHIKLFHEADALLRGRLDWTRRFYHRSTRNTAVSLHRRWELCTACWI